MNEAGGLVSTTAEVNRKSRVRTAVVGNSNASAVIGHLLLYPTQQLSC
jgi:hypothetical protein